MTIGDCINRIYHGFTLDDEGVQEVYSPAQVKNYRRVICSYGVQLYDYDKIAIANNHHMITKILCLGKGYDKIFKRHHGYAGSFNVNFTGDKTRRASVIGGIVKKKESDMTDDEKLARVM
jgi:hypothetical protein